MKKAAEYKPEAQASESVNFAAVRSLACASGLYGPEESGAVHLTIAGIGGILPPYRVVMTGQLASALV